MKKTVKHLKEHILSDVYFIYDNSDFEYIVYCFSGRKNKSNFNLELSESSIKISGENIYDYDDLLYYNEIISNVINYIKSIEKNLYILRYYISYKENSNFEKTENMLDCYNNKVIPDDLCFKNEQEHENNYKKYVDCFVKNENINMKSTVTREIYYNIDDEDMKNSMELKIECYVYADEHSKDMTAISVINEMNDYLHTLYKRALK
jgi:hypothetical protein